MRDIFARKEIFFGNDIFYVQQFPPFEGMKVLGELQKIICPALSGATIGFKDSGILAEVLGGGLMMLSEKLDGESMEKICKMLLNPQYVSVKIDGKGEAERLTEEKIAEIFTGRYFDMIILAVKIAKINFMDFTLLCGLPTGLVNAIENITQMFAANLAENLNATQSFTEQLKAE